MISAGYDAAKIPITNWEPDNHLVVDFHTPKKAGECASGWIYKDFGTWNTELYPSGGNLSHLLGGIPLTFYYNGFAARDNAYANSSEWGKDMRNGAYRIDVPEPIEAACCVADRGCSRAVRLHALTITECTFLA